MRDVATIAREMASNGKQMKQAHDFGRDSAYNRCSDRHWLLLAELNEALKAAGKPMAHELSQEQFAALSTV